LGQREQVEAKKILRQASAWYHQAFLEDPKAQAALAALGLTDTSLYSDFRIGFCNGTLKATVPQQGELRAALKTAGILKDGQEFFEGCLVFPWFTEDDRCLGMWGCPMDTGYDPATASGKYLPGPLDGVYNFPALKRSRSVILTDSILKALYLYQAGFQEVVPLWGGDQSVPEITQDHLRLFQRFATKQVVLTFEDEKTAERLREEEIEVVEVILPDFPCAVEEIEKVLAVGKLEGTKRKPVTVQVTTADGKGYEETETGFCVQYGSRRYEVKGMERGGVKLKASVKAYRKIEPKRFYLDSVDLYSNRSRLMYAKGACGYFGEKEEVIGQDLQKLVELAENFRPKEAATVKPKAMSEAEEGEALAFLKDPKLLERILTDFEACGLAGEEGNKLMGYLAAVSRKLTDPLAVVIQSRSAAGKSTLQEAILRFVPPEDMEKYTRLTGQALFYKDENGLAHKLLAIEEEAGAREASYSIRNLQSSKFLSIATTEKDQVTGKLKTVEYKVKGPVALMLTTTAVDMDYETQNRFITLTIDESREMTERILTHQRELETVEGLRKRRGDEGIVRRHQNAQRLLRPLAVVNPYAPKLTFPANSLRARRDHKKYLGVIKVIAYLHQYQREVKTLEAESESVSYIEVVLADIERANRLCAEVLGQTLDELSAPGRALLAKVREMVRKKGEELKLEPGELRFTRKDIRDFSGWSDFQVKTHIGELEDLEYLYSLSGKKGKEYVYELVAAEGGEDGKPFLAGLMKVEALGLSTSGLSTSGRTTLNPI